MHAGSVTKALSRFERMVKRHPEVDKVDKNDIGDYINGVIVIRNIRQNTQDQFGNDITLFKRQVTEIAEIKGYDEQHSLYAKTTIK